jgi:hypothetical protein
MSANKFKVSDKVKVRNGLIADEYYGGVSCGNSMERMGGAVFTIDCVKNDYYLVKENAFYWSDEMLELVEKALDDLCAGDFVRSGGSVRKVLAAVDGCYLLSHIEKYTHAFAWYTVNELREGGYNFIELDAPEPTIEIDGKKYKKADVDEAIKGLEVVE